MNCSTIDNDNQIVIKLKGKYYDGSLDFIEVNAEDTDIVGRILKGRIGIAPETIEMWHKDK